MLRAVLNGVLSLGDIRDVEKLCDRIATQALGHRVGRVATSEFTSGAMRANLVTEGQREELLAYLIGESWMLWLRFDASDDGRGRKTFSGFAVPQLRCRVLDYWRKKLGRGASPGEWGVVSTEALDAAELERVFGSGRGDDPADRFSAFCGLQPAGGREARGLVDARRRDAPRRVA